MQPSRSTSPGSPTTLPLQPVDKLLALALRVRQMASGLASNRMGDERARVDSRVGAQLVHNPPETGC
jgi:hypothetical protein